MTYQPPIYDGIPYSLVFDRVLRGLHQRVASWVDEGATCLDACCGTGGLSSQLAGRCARVQGIDLSPRMIARAEQLRRRRGLERLSFRVGDVSRLEGVDDGSFDVATVVLGLHEMPAAVRSRVIPELLRVARRAVMLDFAVPMPRNLAGWRNRLIELSGGRRHFAGFRDYTRRGGLRPLIAAAGARLESEQMLDGGTLHLVELTRGGGPP